jgi:hypothetical protein
MSVVHSFLASADALDCFVADWQQHRLPKTAWTHAAHVAVGAYFAFDHDEAATLSIMRPGIRSFNESVGGVNSATAGYHETITRLWVMAIARHLHDVRPATRFAAAVSAVARFESPRELLERHYSWDIVSDQRARAEWVEPDRS